MISFTMPRLVTPAKASSRLESGKSNKISSAAVVGSHHQTSENPPLLPSLSTLAWQEAIKTDEDYDDDVIMHLNMYDEDDDGLLPSSMEVDVSYDVQKDTFFTSSSDHLHPSFNLNSPYYRLESLDPVTDESESDDTTSSSSSDSISMEIERDEPQQAVRALDADSLLTSSASDGGDQSFHKSLQAMTKIMKKTKDSRKALLYLKTQAKGKDSKKKPYDRQAKVDKVVAEVKKSSGEVQKFLQDMLLHQAQ